MTSSKYLYLASCLSAILLSACGSSKQNTTPAVSPNQNSAASQATPAPSPKNIQPPNTNTAPVTNNDISLANNSKPSTHTPAKNNTNSNGNGNNKTNSNSDNNANANNNNQTTPPSLSGNNQAGNGTGSFGAGTATAPINPHVRGSIITITQDRAGSIQASADTQDKYTLVINGRVLDFKPNKIGINSSPADLIHRGNQGGLTHVRYGYLQENKNSPAHFYAQGDITANMPTTGQATYHGNAVHLDGGRLNDSAVARFLVDYGKKTVKGNISTTDTNIALSGKISGNGFSGIENGVHTEGRFYGDNAQELGGTYRNQDGTTSGAFGAKK